MTVVDSTPGSRKVTVAERERLCLDLRKSGRTYREIGAELHVSESRACHITTRALKRVVAEGARDLRLLELTRLDQLQEAVWTAATTSNPEAPDVQYKAVDRVLSIMQRRARLMGLDSAQEVQVVGAVTLEVAATAREAISAELDQIGGRIVVATSHLVEPSEEPVPEPVE